MSAESDDVAEVLGATHEMVRVPHSRTWSGRVGFVVEADPDDPVAMRGTLPVTEAVCQPMGLVHGGMYSHMAEELASIGTGRVVVSEGKWCVGMSNLTHFLRAGVLGDTLHACARPVHRGRTTWVWEVETRNDAGKLCAKTTVTMAVREGEPPGPPA